MRLSRILCAVDNDLFADEVFDLGHDLDLQVNAELGLVTLLRLHSCLRAAQAYRPFWKLRIATPATYSIVS